MAEARRHALGAIFVFRSDSFARSGVSWLIWPERPRSAGALGPSSSAYAARGRRMPPRPPATDSRLSASTPTRAPDTPIDAPTYRDLGGSSPHRDEPAVRHSSPH